MTGPDSEPGFAETGPGSACAASDDALVTGARDVLMVVDVQRDFCPGGSLGVPGGDEVVPVINALIPKFQRWVFTRDWHPHDHVSFSAHPQFRDRSWPPHAVQYTPGAAWCDGLEMPPGAILVNKGDDPHWEEYSGFPKKRFDLAEFLRLRLVERVFIAGLTADYCVLNTALDAQAHGFTTFVIEDAVRGVAPETTAQAFADMKKAGVKVIRAGQVVKHDG
jgi:nicotinamidase-related amidase